MEGAGSMGKERGKHWLAKVKLAVASSSFQNARNLGKQTVLSWEETQGKMAVR